MKIVNVLLVIGIIISSSEGWIIQSILSFLSRAPRIIRRISPIRPYDIRFNELDIPPGPPFVSKKPGPLSFMIGPYRFRQAIYRFEDNKDNHLFVPKAGPLSFRIGKIRFKQIDTSRFTFDPCCTNPSANCHFFIDCFHFGNRTGNLYFPH